jgi:hypothetical protein
MLPQYSPLGSFPSVHPNVCSDTDCQQQSFWVVLGCIRHEGWREIQYGEWEWTASGVASTTIHGTSFRGLRVGSLKSTPPPAQDSRTHSVTQNSTKFQLPQSESGKCRVKIKPPVCRSRAKASQRWGWGNGEMRINRAKPKKSGETRVSVSRISRLRTAASSATAALLLLTR